MALLVASNLKKNYQVENRTIPVLHGINLEIHEQDFCGIVGPSGSGKTTLLYVLSGLEQASEGSVKILGNEWSEMSSFQIQDVRKRQISFIFQFYNLLPNLTVYENIQLPMILAKDFDFSRIEEVLKWVGMDEYKDYFPNQLSGGMQQRVAIARALINRPQIIFADEPTGNLDQKSGSEVMNLLKKIHLEHNVTVLMVTHNPDNLKYCSRTIKLLDGRIQSDDSVQV
ncbi:MAG: ABC transporter ATP-binding protein [Firmicutes bacterium]|nr:ABC transporter ATP-binding protein [Bacillota bacterium]